MTFGAVTTLSSFIDPIKTNYLNLLRVGVVSNHKMAMGGPDKALFLYILRSQLHTPTVIYV